MAQPGDFDGSGIVEFQDLLLIAQHYGSSLASNGEIRFDSSIAARFESDWQSALASVPEPHVAMVVGAMSLLVFRRRAR